MNDSTISKASSCKPCNNGCDFKTSQTASRMKFTKHYFYSIDGNGHVAAVGNAKNSADHPCSFVSMLNIITCKCSKKNLG